MPSKREQLLEIMEGAAKGETKATLRARIAELEAEIERLTKEAESYRDIAARKSNQVADMIHAEALSRTGAVKERREDVAKLVYEAMSWAAMCGPAQNGTVPVWVDRGNSLGQEEARRTADRILSALTAEPAAPEGQQEPVAWMDATGTELHKIIQDYQKRDMIASGGRQAERAPNYSIALYTRPAEQAVTEAMVARASAEYQEIFGRYLLSSHARRILKAAMGVGG